MFHPVSVQTNIFGLLVVVYSGLPCSANLIPLLQNYARTSTLPKLTSLVFWLATRAWMDPPTMVRCSSRRSCHADRSQSYAKCQERSFRKSLVRLIPLRSFGRSIVGNVHDFLLNSVFRDLHLPHYQCLFWV